MRILLLTLVLVTLVEARPAHASQFGAILDGPIGWLLFACMLVGLFIFAQVCRQGSRYLTEKTHASQVARLMDVLASQADGIAGMLLAHPPAPTATLQIVRDAAIAQSIAYAKINLPDTIMRLGASDGVMATRLANFISQKTLDAAAVAPMIAGDSDAAEIVSGVLASATPLPAALPAA